MSPLAQPKASSRSPKPLCFASTREGWWAFVVEWRAYVAAPAGRGLGFGLSFMPVLALILAALVGALRST